MAEPEDQRGSGSTSTAAMAEQAIIDGGVSVTAKDKRSNEVVTEHHGNSMKLEPGFARAEAHRRATTTVKRTRRRCYRPRGRKATSGGPRQNQAPRLGWVGSQVVGGTEARFAEMVKALRRRRKLDGAAVAATGKTEEQNGEKRRR